ncbi:hypothetical protein ACLOJK_032171 [Asimina triloba]
MNSTCKRRVSGHMSDKQQARLRLSDPERHGLASTARQRLIEVSGQDIDLGSRP